MDAMGLTFTKKSKKQQHLMPPGEQGAWLGLLLVHKVNKVIRFTAAKARIP
jgi:hypothetical protein